MAERATAFKLGLRILDYGTPLKHLYAEAFIKTWNGRNGFLESLTQAIQMQGLRPNAGDVSKDMFQGVISKFPAAGADPVCAKILRSACRHVLVELQREQSNKMQQLDEDLQKLTIELEDKAANIDIQEELVRPLVSSRQQRIKDYTLFMDSRSGEVSGLKETEISSQDRSDLKKHQAKTLEESFRKQVQLLIQVFQEEDVALQLKNKTYRSAVLRALQPHVSLTEPWTAQDLVSQLQQFREEVDKESSLWNLMQKRRLHTGGAHFLLKRISSYLESSQELEKPTDPWEVHQRITNSALKAQHSGLEDDINAKESELANMEKDISLRSLRVCAGNSVSRRFLLSSAWVTNSLTGASSSK